MRPNHLSRSQRHRRRPQRRPALQRLPSAWSDSFTARVAGSSPPSVTAPAPPPGSEPTPYGRPGKETRYRKVEKTRFELGSEVDAAKVAYDAATDGCFPLVSNEGELSDAELLAAYRYQPNLEKRHHELKSVLGAAPVSLKSPSRIEGLFCCEFIALLCSCLIERELRAAMSREGVPELPLYHEGRASSAPTAARVFDLFAEASRHRLLSDGEVVQVFEPELTSLQRQVLELLGVPETAYLSPAPGS